MAIPLLAGLLSCSSEAPEGGANGGGGTGGMGGATSTGGEGGEAAGGAGGEPLPNCLPDWEPRRETGRCYRGLFTLDYDSSIAACESLGGSLVVPSSDTEFELVVIKLCPYLGSCWLAATDRETEGVFEWEDGTPVVFPEGIEWAPGEPDDDTQAQDQDCLAAEREFMTDRYCNNLSAAFCVRDAE